MSSQWVYTPRTLPPRVLFPENEESDEADDSESDEPRTPRARECDQADVGTPVATPVQEMFCLQRRMCREEEGDTVHTCEACNDDIGVGLCSGCNDFICYGCCLKPTAEGCEGVACSECGFMACGSCCYATLPAFHSGCSFPSPFPNKCDSCPGLWRQWLQQHAHVPPPPVSTGRKRKTFDRFFTSLTPKTERTLNHGRSLFPEACASSHPMLPASSPVPAPTAAPTLDLIAYETLDGLPSSQEEDTPPSKEPRQGHQQPDSSSEPDVNAQSIANVEERAQDEADQQQQQQHGSVSRKAGIESGRLSSVIARRCGSLQPLEIRCSGRPAPIPVLTPINSPCLENGGEAAAAKDSPHVHVALQDVDGNSLLGKPLESQLGRHCSGKVGSESYSRRSKRVSCLVRKEPPSFLEQ